ncbi:Methylthioadenosine phosphorylase [Sistotremastrum suecicum HHB10207 ss-3]|uniref:S-methyl-5'-thioadenosine phosphorylase n=1 Tax=Sistotremastrum suecicum HHB10207 ss-3 TaxID=1314776 RepID=A0A166FRR2_9AGAM|nr:Methylthioadenosine phosphorylase [Sistotremastrum suecicum HHB10207 ss-3]
MSAEPKVLIGVIGGSGLYNLGDLTVLKEVHPETPWGLPSSPITIASLPSGVLVAFLARHGSNHSFSPSSIPVRANISALKSLGVKAIIAFSAVGSLREEIKPGDFVIPSQIIDRTKGIRPASFFEGTSVVAHAGFGDPFSGKLTAWLEKEVKKALDAKNVDLHTDKCVVCMEGPQFSTRAESKMYRHWGGDIINMSVLPEAKLAREAELSYALIATATDYDSWRPHEAAVTVADVFKTLKTNAEISRHVTAAVLTDLHAAVEEGDILTESIGAMKFSIMRPATTSEDLAKLHYILPEYFPAA